MKTLETPRTRETAANPPAPSSNRRETATPPQPAAQELPRETVRHGEAVDLRVRSIALQPGTLDETNRSVEAVIATEDPIVSTDLRTWMPVLEVLRMDGAEIPEQIPLLDSHNRYSIEAQIGSVRDLRVQGKTLVGRLYFSAAAEAAWTKVKEGHLKDVSVGQRSLASTSVAAGTSGVVGEKTYRAPKDRDLVVNTRWQPREVSLTPIGADPRAKIRSHKEHPMNERLRKFLETLGLRREADEAEAQALYDQLPPADKARADIAAKSQPANTPPLDGQPPAAPPQTQRSEPPAAPPAEPATPAETVRAAIGEALAAERTRRRELRELAGSDVPAELLRQAEDEGWDTARASREFLTAVRASRAAPVGPAIHVRGQDQDCTARSLGAALMIRSGLDPVRQAAVFEEGCYRPMRDEERNRNADLLRAADLGWRYRDMSLVDICREAVRMDGRPVPVSRAETIRAAVSGSTLTAIFTTNVSAMLMAGYNDAADSTIGWCSESEVPNFQSNERAMMGKFGALQKLGRGKTAEHLAVSDSKEEYKIARYAGQFVVDEQDIIDDRFGALEQFAPQDMGLTARQLRANLVYAILLANAALSDTGALFNSTAITTAGGHANLTTGALAAATLQASVTMMAKQRIAKRPLNLRPRFLIVPQDLLMTATLLLSSEFRYSSEGSLNPLKNLGIEVRSDDRAGVGGVVDPATGTAYAGTATNYFLSARPGEEGAKTIEVGYLRGTGRAPQLRSFALDKGQWGIGWDVNMDIGAKALDFRGLVKSTGA